MFLFEQLDSQFDISFYFEINWKVIKLKYILSWLKLNMESKKSLRGGISFQFNHDIEMMLRNNRTVSLPCHSVVVCLCVC